MEGSVGEEGGIAVGLALWPASRINAPTVANQKQHRLSHGRESAAVRKRHKPVLALTSTKAGFYIALVKRRNQLLALACLLVFFAFGVFYFRTWVVQKPFGIILFIGEGMDPSRLATARIYAAGADTPLTIDSLPYCAVLKNYSKDFGTPDQAAAASALATGTKVKNGSLGTDAEGKALENLFELARENGRMTGLVTNSLLTDPTPAGFYAHTSVKEDRTELARVLAENAEIDIILGGGAADFLPVSKEGARADERDLVQEMGGTGYDLVQNLEELDAIPRWRRARLLGLFSPAELAPSADEESRGDQPTLSDMVRRSIELLQFNSGGYVLVVDAGLMGRAARARNGRATLAETVELDHAVSTALRYAGAKSTIIVCGDVGIGGLTLNGFPPRENEAAVFQTDAGADRWLSWAAERYRPPVAQAPDGTADAPDGAIALGQSEETTAAQTNSAENTASDVMAFGSGLGADALQGTLDSTVIFEIIRDNL